MKLHEINNVDIDLTESVTLASDIFHHAQYLGMQHAYSGGTWREALEELKDIFGARDALRLAKHPYLIAKGA